MEEFWNSHFSKEAIARTIQAVKNSVIVTKARNVLNPENMKAVATKAYDDVIKATIAKTKTLANEKLNQLHDTPIGNTAFATHGPTGPTTIREVVEQAKDSLSQIKVDGNGKGEVSQKTNTVNGVTKDEYKSLRKKTPNNEIRKTVNPDGPKVDPVYGYKVDKFEADHIVSMKEITEMDGFNRLTKEPKIEVLNLKDNFVGLGKSTNASKGAHSWADWRGHSKLGEVPANVRMEMLELEEQAREALKVAIEERLK